MKYAIDDGTYLANSELQDCLCGYDCGKKIESHYDDCGGFYVTTPRGYAAICSQCFREHGHSTCER